MAGGSDALTAARRSAVEESLQPLHAGTIDIADPQIGLRHFPGAALHSSILHHGGQDLEFSLTDSNYPRTLFEEYLHTAIFHSIVVIPVGPS